MKAITVGTKVTIKYGTNVGEVVKANSHRVWVKWDHSEEPIPYQRGNLRAVA